MPSLRSLVLLALPLLASTISAQPNPEATELLPQPKHTMANGEVAWKELLNAVPEESLHAALHNLLHPKFQDGVYEHNREALERVHRDNPPLATKLVSVAQYHYDLRKRQNTTTTPTSQPEQSASTTTSQDTVVVPVEVSTTDSAGSATTITSSALANPTASVEVAVTTTNSAGSTITTTTRAPAVVLETTNAAGSTIRTTSAVSRVSEPTPTVMETTDSAGHTFLTTYTPTGPAISSLVLITTTLPNGQQSVITSFATAGGQVTGKSGGNANPSGTKAPSLQNAAPAARATGVVGLGVAVLGAALLV